MHVRDERSRLTSWSPITSRLRVCASDWPVRALTGFLPSSPRHASPLLPASWSHHSPIGPLSPSDMVICKRTITPERVFWLVERPMLAVTVRSKASPSCAGPARERSHRCSYPMLWQDHALNANRASISGMFSSQVLEDQKKHRSSSSHTWIGYTIDTYCSDSCDSG